MAVPPVASGQAFVSRVCGGISSMPAGLLVVGGGPQGPTDQGLNSQPLPQVLVVPPQTNYTFQGSLSHISPVPRLQPQAEKVPGSLPPPAPSTSTPVLYSTSLPPRSQNPKDFTLALCHHIPLWWPWGRWQPMAKQTSNRGMMCQSPLSQSPPDFTGSTLGLPFLHLGEESHHGTSSPLQGPELGRRAFCDWSFPQKARSFSRL